MKRMAKTSSVTRVPRGTKILAKAFFAAADEIPEPQRAEVVKAALALIRDELKAAREKVAIAKAKAKEKAGKTSASPPRKSASVTKAPAKIQKKTAPVQAKVPVKRASKTGPKAAEKTVPDEPIETTAWSDS
jgi:hypothetical protein